jgi:glycosyltransferase involved in cell wall biosynthesis
MKVLHIMLSRGLGGIEQVFLDYTAMLRAEGIEVLPVIHPTAAISEHVSGAILLPNWGKWDIGAIWRLYKIVRQYQPDIILTHGNRALSFARYAKGKTPLFPVAHNYWLRGFRGLKNAIAITEDVAKNLRNIGVFNVHVVPNVVQAPAEMPPHDALKSPPVIGTMGRFVHKKGFDLFLHALAELKTQAKAFKAVIGGGGEEETALKKLCSDLGLEQDVTFIGWVKDKAPFFASLDVFCLPSRSEPFGIVLLEAFAHGVPVVSTRNEGASQIATHEKDALLMDEGNLAEGLKMMLSHPDIRNSLRDDARLTAQQYHPNIIGKRLKAILT